MSTLGDRRSDLGDSEVSKVTLVPKLFNENLAYLKTCGL